MNTTTTFQGLRCLDCGDHYDPGEAASRCPECKGLLEATYDLEGPIDRATIDGRDDVGPYRYAEFLPFPRETAVTIEEGATPQVECPTLADELGVDTVLLKDEGRNPTAAVADRGLSLAVTAAAERGAGDVALPTTGNGGQAAAAYAARAGLDSHSFVPTRCPFVNKAMVNVHGGEMSVVEGRYDDALDVYKSGCEDGWEPVGPVSPYRREGAKTVYFELVDALGWEAPDAVVVPTGHGIVVAGIYAAIQDLEAAGILDNGPRIYAAQPDGCAPIVAAFEGATPVEPADRPDTIVGPLEIAEPVVGDLAVEALEATGGGAVAVDDDATLEAGTDAASGTGVEVGATGGVGVAGARALADDGAFDSDDTVTIVNPVAGSKEADLLRSYLMSQGM